MPVIGPHSLNNHTGALFPLVMTFKDTELPSQGLEMQGTGEMSVLVQVEMQWQPHIPLTEPI